MEGGGGTIDNGARIFVNIYFIFNYVCVSVCGYVRVCAVPGSRSIGSPELELEAVGNHLT